MLNYLKKTYLLEDKSAQSLIKSIVYTALMNISQLLGVFIMGLVVNRIILDFTGIRELEVQWLVLILTFLAILIGTYFIYLRQYDAVYNQTYDQSAERRINLAEKIRKLPLAYFDRHDVDDIANTLMQDCKDIEFAFSHAVPQMIGGIISSIIVSIILFFIDWRLTLCLLSVVPIALFLLYLSEKSLKKVDSKTYHYTRAFTNSMQEFIENIREIQSSNFEDKSLEKLYMKLDKVEEESKRSEILRGIFLGGAQIILKIGFVLTILLGLSLYSQEQISLFVFLIFILMASRFYEPINTAMIFSSALISVGIRIDRLRELEQWPQHTGLKECQVESYDLTFNRVHFAYNEGDEVLEDISFVAKQGEVTALIGPSGSGKTTIGSLAARFWDPIKGNVYLDDINISSIDEEVLLKHYSFVFQNVVLFDTDIMENIRIGKKDASDEEVKKAAERAQCLEFIEKLPDGYKTNIGENGVRLSGGQRQRISIARAILKDAPIVILDEATASLDVGNETAIQKAISSLIQNKTVLVIAHRMRTVAGADQVIVLKDGKVVEKGKAKDLLEKDSIFAHMYKLQYQK